MDSLTTPRIRRPDIDPDPRTAPFWEAAQRGVLAIQRCAECMRMHHPPVPVCPDCHGTRFEFTPVGGTGAVYALSIMRQPRVVGFEVPYVCIVVELDEQPGLFVVGNLTGMPVEAARVGTRVVVQFEEYGDAGMKLPQFVPATEVPAQ